MIKKRVLADISQQKTLVQEMKNDQDNLYFYKKDKSRKIAPIFDKKINFLAKQKLDFILINYKTKLPIKFINNWEKIKLFETKGNLERAHSIFIDSTDGMYDLKNSLNHMTGKEWTIFSCSWFIFNALSKDIKEEREICKETQDHPATYSPTMMESFIKFFTKEGMTVLDPFMGIGSTLVGCKRTGRIGYGIELNPKYFSSALKRTPEFRKNMINGDARDINKYFKGKRFNFCISSPPYWDVLNRSTDSFRQNREAKGLDVNYSDNKTDLGNISNYNLFLEELSKVYIDLYEHLELDAYLVIIVKNIKKEGQLYPLAWDLARILSKKYSLKDEKIWIQDKIGLSPYGYPHTWASNILHHYCLIFKKEV